MVVTNRFYCIYIYLYVFIFSPHHDTGAQISHISITQRVHHYKVRYYNCNFDILAKVFYFNNHRKNKQGSILITIFAHNSNLMDTLLYFFIIIHEIEANITTCHEMLVYHVQNLIAITLLESEREQNEIFIEFELRRKKC